MSKKNKKKDSIEKGLIDIAYKKSKIKKEKKFRNAPQRGESHKKNKIKKDDLTQKLFNYYLGKYGESTLDPKRVYSTFRYVANYLPLSQIKNIEITDIGTTGLIFHLNNTAWKASFEIDKEKYFLRKIHRKNKTVEHIINISQNDHGDYIKEIEFIHGNTLNEIINNGEIIKQDILDISRGILKGIMELRIAGIYHRDLHDKNIMIETQNYRSVIIDLGAATENPEEIHPLNRGYGGNNDLVSLGQLMYKMATSNNLFNDGFGYSCQPITKDSIKSEREEAYQCFIGPKGEYRKLNESYHQKIYNTVKDDTLSDLIIMLLDDDLMKQPTLEDVIEAKEVFEAYVK